jgi:hypothetical protein
MLANSVDAVPRRRGGSAPERPGAGERVPVLEEAWAVVGREGYLMPGRLGCVSKGYKGIKVATATNEAKQNAHSQYTGWIWICIVT